MICVIDCGISNIGSIVNALRYLDLKVDSLGEPKNLDRYSHFILPGVGSFPEAMNNLHSSGWSNIISEKICAGHPFLGICLGMQLLFDSSDEYGDTKGLGLISGVVRRFEPSTEFRVPHIGWNNLSFDQQHPIFHRVNKADFYFVHSYHCAPTFPNNVVARCEYGENFVAAASQRNLVGVQFHPEKSQDVGLKLLENFARWDGEC